MRLVGTKGGHVTVAKACGLTISNGQNDRGAQSMAAVSYSGQIATLLAQYQQKGAAEAKSYRPPTDATHPDANEVALRAEAEKSVTQQQRAFNDALTDAGRINSDVQRKLFDAEAEAEQALADNSLSSSVDAELAGEKLRLVQLTEERIDAEVDIKAFRAKHNIDGPPNYPESQIYHFALIAVFLLIETGINSFFYSNEAGLLGGAVIALSVSALNLMSAALLGMGFRYKNIPHPRSQAAGWGCLIAFIASAIYFNALFATFRSQAGLIADPSDPAALSRAFIIASEEALKAFVFQANFLDIMSFLLFGIGIMLSIFAFYKGYTADDPVPEHSRKDRRLKAALAEEAQGRQLVRKKINEFSLDRRSRLQGLLSQPSTLAAHVNQAVANVEQAATQMKASVSEIQRDYLLVLDAYRQSNLAVRGINPPAYFSNKPSVIGSVDGSQADPVKKELAGLAKRLEAHREKYKDALNTALNTLQNDMAGILNNRFNVFIEDIEEEAKSNFKQRNVIMLAEGAL